MGLSSLGTAASSCSSRRASVAGCWDLKESPFRKILMQHFFTVENVAFLYIEALVIDMGSATVSVWCCHLFQNGEFLTKCLKCSGSKGRMPAATANGAVGRLLSALTHSGGVATPATARDARAFESFISRSLSLVTLLCAFFFIVDCCYLLNHKAGTRRFYVAPVRCLVSFGNALRTLANSRVYSESFPLFGHFFVCVCVLLHSRYAIEAR